MENKRKHLEFIQAIISRMASNLFFLRGWTITLIGALLALFSKNNSPDYVFYFLLVIVLIFWILDGYFLSQERSYRDLYNHVSKLKLWQEKFLSVINTEIQAFSIYHASANMTRQQQGIMLMYCKHTLTQMTT